jgi:class 3 adenylate cyclase
MQPQEQMRSVVFADVSGSTSLYETLGDSRAHTLIAECLRQLAAVVAAHHGRVVKTVGDELICVFDSADAGVRAASDMQSALDARRASDPAFPFIRIGVQYGHVLEVDGDVYGDTVNLCARVVGLAKGGQILTTGTTVDALSPFHRTSCRPLYAIDVKGREERVAICEVIWKVDDTLTMIGGPSSVTPSLLSRLRLSHRCLDYLLDDERRFVTVGRGADNEVIVAAKTASRRHARVFVRDGKFVLADESANGTFVRFEHQGEMMLRREETVLVGRGVIGLGESTVAAGDDLISFEVI